MRSLSEIAKQLRVKLDREYNSETIKERVREYCQKLDELFIDRMGDEYMLALDGAGIKRSIFAWSKVTILRLEGYDTLNRPRALDLPINEKILQEFSPDSMIMLVDKYILRGYEIPEPNPDGTISFNVSLEDLGPAMDFPSAN